MKVNVADPQYQLGRKNVTQNGIYQAGSDGYDAYSEVQVNVDVPVEQFGDYTLSWQKISDVGYGDGVTLCGYPTEWNGAIYTYAFSSNTFKSFDGSSWNTLTAITSPPSSVYIVVYNNQLHALSGANHYVWDGVAWTQLPVSNPEAFTRSSITAFEYQGSLHVLYYTGYARHHWVFNGSAWTSLQSFPQDSTQTSWYSGCTYKLNNEQHVVYNGKDFKYEGDVFTQVTSWGNAYQPLSTGIFSVYGLDKALGNTEVSNNDMQMKSSN